MDGNVVLDLGFTTKVQRGVFSNRGAELKINAEIHYFDAPLDIRKQCVETRNQEKDLSVYAFEVTDMMFSFMESKFEISDHVELRHGLKVIV